MLDRDDVDEDRFRADPELDGMALRTFRPSRYVQRVRVRHLHKVRSGLGYQEFFQCCAETTDHRFERVEQLVADVPVDHDGRVGAGLDELPADEAVRVTIGQPGLDRRIQLLLALVERRIEVGLDGVVGDRGFDLPALVGREV